MENSDDISHMLHYVLWALPTAVIKRVDLQTASCQLVLKLAQVAELYRRLADKF